MLPAALTQPSVLLEEATRIHQSAGLASPAGPKVLARQKKKPRRSGTPSSSVADEEQPIPRKPRLRHRHSMPRSSSVASSSTAHLRRSRSFAYSDAASAHPTDAATIASAVASVDSALEAFAAAEEAGGGIVNSVPVSREQRLEAEILRLRSELLAARRGAHVSERVDTEMRRVKRLWHDSEHRLLLLQSELRTAKVTQDAVAADLRHLEELSAQQAERIDELVRGAALEHTVQRERALELEKARDAARKSRLESSELSLQMVAATATVSALRTEVGLLEDSLVTGEAETRRLLVTLHGSAVERAAQHKKQLNLWEARASTLIDAGPSAKLDLILMQGNADLFENFRSLLKEQRDTCAKEDATLKAWLARGDGRTREQMAGQIELMRSQLEDVRKSRDHLHEALHSEEVQNTLGKVDEATRAIRQLETQLAEERRRSAQRERKAADAAAEHRQAVAHAVEELKHAASEMDGGLNRVVSLETEAVVTLQKQEAFRARTARLLLLQKNHRPILAKCYRAWQGLTAQAVGVRLAEGGPANAIAEIRNRSLSKAITGGAMGGVAGAGGAGVGAGSGGVLAASMGSAYMKSTLDALEEEWATREAHSEGRVEEIAEELRAAKALAAQAMKETDEQKQRLDRQAASLASEGEALRRSNQLAREAERAAERELAHLKARIERQQGGGQVDAVKAGLEKAAAEREAESLRAQLDGLKEAHAAELGVLRQAVTDSELSRLRQQEATTRSTKVTAQAERRAIEEKERAIYAAQREVGKQVEASETAKKELESQFEVERQKLVEEAKESKAKVTELESKVSQLTDLQQRTANRLHEAELEKEELRAEMGSPPRFKRNEAGEVIMPTGSAGGASAVAKPPLRRSSSAARASSTGRRASTGNEEGGTPKLERRASAARRSSTGGTTAAASTTTPSNKPPLSRKASAKRTNSATPSKPVPVARSESEKLLKLAARLAE